MVYDIDSALQEQVLQGKSISIQCTCFTKERFSVIKVDLREPSLPVSYLISSTPIRARTAKLAAQGGPPFHPPPKKKSCPPELPYYCPSATQETDIFLGSSYIVLVERSTVKLLGSRF